MAPAERSRNARESRATHGGVWHRPCIVPRQEDERRSIMRALSATLALGFIVTIGVGGATADTQCMQDAKEARTECKTSCDDDFTIARDLCRNIDPVCAAGCREDREDCRGAVFGALDQCVDGCRVQLDLDRAACPRRGRDRDRCLDRAQVRAFVCRDECREELQVRSGLNDCRDAFRGCMAGCVVTDPGPTVPVPTETPVPTRTATPKPTVTVTPVVPR
jgi:hypothetical protein